MIDSALARFHPFDILVNNAGASVVQKLESHSDEDMRTAFRVTKAQGYGRIANAHVFTAGYNASKEALRALTSPRGSNGAVVVSRPTSYAPWP